MAAKLEPNIPHQYSEHIRNQPELSRIDRSVGFNGRLHPCAFCNA